MSWLLFSSLLLKYRKCVNRLRARESPHFKSGKLTEILDVSRLDKLQYRYDQDRKFRLQVEVKTFYATLFMLRSRCIDGDDERLTLIQGYTVKKDNYTSDLGCQMTVHLKHEQYQALGEILNELPNAMDRYCCQFRGNGNRYTAQFPRTYSAERCNPISTWIGRQSLSYDWLLSFCDSVSEGLESLLVGAEALLSLLCETVPNFEDL